MVESAARRPAGDGAGAFSAAGARSAEPGFFPALIALFLDGVDFIGYPRRGWKAEEHEQPSYTEAALVCNGKLQSCCRACPELVEGPSANSGQASNNAKFG